MIEKGQVIPFDIRDVRAIEYDLRPRPLRDGDYKDMIVNQIRAIEAAGWRGSVPFGNGLSALGAVALECEATGRQKDVEGSDFTVRVFAEANRMLLVCGFSLAWLARLEDQQQLLHPIAGRGTQISLLAESDTNPAMGHHLIDAGNKPAVLRMREAMRQSARTLRRTAERKGIEFRRLGAGWLPFFLVANEREAIVTPYLASDYPAKSPTFRARAGSQFYNAWLAEFRHHWAAAAPGPES